MPRYCQAIFKPGYRLTLGNVRAGRVSPTMAEALLEEIKMDLQAEFVSIARKLDEVARVKKQWSDWFR
jgi:hypothetical protein